jgi:hypothetical protein
MENIGMKKHIGKKGPNPSTCPQTIRDKAKKPNDPSSPNVLCKKENSIEKKKNFNSIAGPHPPTPSVCEIAIHENQYTSKRSPSLNPRPERSTSFQLGMPAIFFLSPLTLEEL